MERQLRRYFVGMISFAFVVSWIAVGATAAFLGALAALVTTTIVPALLDMRRTRPRTTRRRQPANTSRPRSMASRPLADEGREELPLVPDEPSLIIGVAD